MAKWTLAELLNYESYSHGAGGAHGYDISVEFNKATNGYFVRATNQYAPGFQISQEFTPEEVQQQWPQAKQARNYSQFVAGMDALGK